jgi:hypothetical protein
MSHGSLVAIVLYSSKTTPSGLVPRRRSLWSAPTTWITDPFVSTICISFSETDAIKAGGMYPSSNRRPSCVRPSQ